MREIKFRIWDGERMWNQHPHNNAFVAVHIFPVLEELIPVKRIPKSMVMQYTGLKDKNGKEIWEWDVVGVKIYDGPPERYININYVVGWNQFGQWGCGVLNSGFPESLYCHADSCEVLGNRFENPELLEVKS